jgi:Restriction endonuclease
MDAKRHERDIHSLIQGWISRCAGTGSEIPQVLDEIITQTRPGGLIDPEDQIALSRAWDSVALRFLDAGVPYQSVAVYNRVLNHLHTLQNESKRRYHKGTFLHNLARAHLALGDRSTALWYHRLAYVEDCLQRDVGQTARPEGNATAMLRLFHGVSNATLDAWLNVIGDASKLDPTLDEERIKLWFPEVSVVDIALRGGLGSTRVQARFDMPLNRILVSELESKLDVGSRSVRGRSLERLAAYLCLTLPGANIQHHFRSGYGELDLVLVLSDAQPSYFVESLGATILVECKNWGKSVGVQPINHFAAKVRLHGCRTGILIAKKSISGTRQLGRRLSDGQLVLQGWFHQDGIIICVIDRAAILSLTDGTGSFSELVLKKFDALRFAYSRSDKSNVTKVPSTRQRPLVRLKRS